MIESAQYVMHYVIHSAETIEQYIINNFEGLDEVAIDKTQLLKFLNTVITMAESALKED
jgi:hypothetical protein